MVVGDGQHSPDQPREIPGIRRSIQPGGKDVRTEATGERHLDVGSDAIGVTVAGTKPTSKLQGQPSPHPHRGDSYPLFGKGVGWRHGEHLGEALDERFDSISGVETEQECGL